MLCLHSEHTLFQLHQHITYQSTHWSPKQTWSSYCRLINNVPRVRAAPLRKKKKITITVVNSEVLISQHDFSLTLETSGICWACLFNSGMPWTFVLQEVFDWLYNTLFNTDASIWPTKANKTISEKIGYSYMVSKVILKNNATWIKLNIYLFVYLFQWQTA